MDDILTKIEEKIKKQLNVFEIKLVLYFKD
jgi:hypothetical protein